MRAPWHLAATLAFCLALTSCGQQAAQPQDGLSGADKQQDKLEETLGVDAEKDSAPAEQAAPAADSAPAAGDVLEKNPAPVEDAADEQSPWLGTWWSDDGESLVVTAVSAEAVTLTYNGWTASGSELFHSDYEMAFQDAEHLVCSAPTGQSWDYVLHLEGDHIRMESRYPDRFFYREGAVQANEPFYGIWCFASKDEQEAQQAADGYRQQGLDAQVFLTTNWENLNPEPWYVVSAGAWQTETEAQQALAAVQAVQPDAYVKYTGAWLG